MRRTLQEFKDFALKGNLLELAVAFVLGVAFAAVVTSLVDDVIMQLVAAVVSEPDFSDLTFAVGDGEVRYGAFLTALASFLVVALALFVIVKAVSRVMPPKVDRRECPHCLTSVPATASVCAACARELPRSAPA